MAPVVVVDVGRPPRHESNRVAAAAASITISTKAETYER